MITFATLLLSAALLSPGNCLESVDPLIGTDGEGGTMPYVGVPFGSVMWVPMTRESQFSKVAFDCADTNLLGFAASRQMAIAMGEWGEFSFQPSVGPGVPDCDVATRGLPIDARASTFLPHFCSMTAGGVKTEYAALSHAAIYRITFPAGQTPRIVFDASRDSLFTRFPDTASVQPGGVEIREAGRTLVAWNTDRTDWYRCRPLPNFRARFRLTFSATPVSFGTFERLGAERRVPVVTHASATCVSNDCCGAYAVFASADDGPTTLYVKCGVSLIDDAQCAANLADEIPDWDLAAVERAAKAEWVAKFDRLKLATVRGDVRTIFATALYHALQWPRDITEGGRYYSAFDDRVHAGVAYTGQSLWDTYRAENALLGYLAPERMGGMMQSLVNMSDEGGRLPLYPNPGETSCMVGAPAEIQLAEACLKGVKGFDVAAAYAAARRNATEPVPCDATCRWRDQERWPGFPEGRGGLTTYASLGYVACDRTCQSVSRTQDFAHADDAMARFAAALGNAEDAAFFAARSHAWTNLWKSAARNVAPRNAAGEWCDPKALHVDGNPYDGVYSECSAELARWSVPHDVGRLVELLGGADAAAELLDGFVAIAYRGYWGGVHSNEPSHHIPYLYNLLGRHDDCARTVRMILEKCYRTRQFKDGRVTDAGLHGHDDCGQMSAWYLFSALGFYPVNPVDLTYRIGSPIVDGAILCAGERPLRIVVQNQSKQNVLVESVTLNGAELKDRTIRHADIMAGGELVFQMRPIACAPSPVAR